MTRKEILDTIAENKKKISRLIEENKDLHRESLLICDEEQRFEEKNEVKVTVRGRRKIEKVHLIGRVYWNEEFTDGDTNEKIIIERSRVVRVDGNWLNF